MPDNDDKIGNKKIIVDKKTNDSKNEKIYLTEYSY